MAADNTLISVDLSDDPRLRYNGTAIKRRAFITLWATEIDKEIRINLTLKFYANNGGAYGADAETSINADNGLTAEQKAYQRQTFADRAIIYSTRGRWVLADGTPVSEGTPNAITELEYWQGFRLDDVPNITDMNFKALDAVYETARAMVQRMDVLKVLG